MRRMTRFKVGLVAVLWAFIAAAAFAGWMIGHGSAKRTIGELERRLAAVAAPKTSCGVEAEPLKAQGGAPPRSVNVFGVALHGILLRAPQHPHLRELLTAR